MVVEPVAGGGSQAGLRKTTPYWFEFKTFSKQRWFGRELIEIMTTEFRDRTKEYYVWAIHKGICSVNGKKADIHQIISDGDQICNRVHRHEPPITDEPVKILHRDDAKGMLVIVKPGSIPVHAAGRYLRHTLVGILESEHGVERVYTTNRLDRLTSGVMVCSTKKETASKLGAQFAAGLVNKAYVCRVRGKFPEGEVACKEPILTIDRQSGVNIVHPKGKHCETVFVRLSYDAESDTSAVFCRPITGRTHQIRVHVQYLGHPISNDPIYGHNIWDKIDRASFAQVVPDQWKKVGGEIGQKEVERIVDAIKGDQDGQEDWARWKDEVLFREMIKEEGLENVYVPGPNGRSSRPSDELVKRALQKLEQDDGEIPAKGLNRPNDIETAWQKRVREQSSDFCPECKIPLLPDPKAEELYIYLHAIKYWTDDWVFEDSLPWWARQDWKSISPNGSGASTDAGEATLPRGLAVAEKDQFQLSSTPMSSLISAEIQEKASRLAEPEKWTEQDQGVQITRARQLVDFSPNHSASEASKTEQLSRRLQRALRAVPLQVPIAFQVFGGFEDFAQREILQQIAARQHQHPISALPAGISSSVHSAHVHIQVETLVAPALQAFMEARLAGVKTAYLLTARHDFPRELAAQLKHEKATGGTSKRSKWKAKELRKAIANGRRKVPTMVSNQDVQRQREKTAEEEENDLDFGNLHLEEGNRSETTSEDAPRTTFASEIRLLQLLDDVWVSSTDQLDKALASWISIREATTGEGLRSEQLSYRATVDRATYNLPSLTSQSIERHVGELAWHWLNDANTTTAKWRVDLEQPLLDVTLKFLPGFGIADEFEKELDDSDDPNLKSEGQIVFMLKMPMPAVRHARRPEQRNEILVGGTTMAEYRAATLALALPLPIERSGTNGLQQDASLKPLRILEPCCGHGSLLFETASLLEAKGLRGEILGCDVEEDTVHRAKKIGNLAGFSEDGEAVQVRLQAVDVTQAEALEAFVGGAGTIDSIITDLPWGKRERASQSLSKLYAAFLQSWFSVLRTGGYIVAVTAEHKTLSRCLAVFETLCRKKRYGAILKMQSVEMLSHTDPGQSPDNDSFDALVKTEDDRVKQQGVLEAKRNSMMRKIEIGYHVYVFMIRKVAA